MYIYITFIRILLKQFSFQVIRNTQLTLLKLMEIDFYSFSDYHKCLSNMRITVLLNNNPNDKDFFPQSFISFV